MKQAKRTGRGWLTRKLTYNLHSKGLRNLGVRQPLGIHSQTPKCVCLMGTEEQVKQGVHCGFWGLCGPSSLLSVLPGLSWCQIGSWPATCSFVGLFLGCTLSVSTEDLELVVLHVSSAWVVVPMCPLLCVLGAG